MAQWTQTLEPYVKVHEAVKTTTLNPTAGEDLIIGVTLISDAGPSTPTLISSQSEFLSTYSSQDITRDYIESLNKLYTGEDKTTAATMWANAYRLAGSNTLLVTRALKGEGVNYVRPLNMNDSYEYIIRDGELLRKVSGKIKFVVNVNGDEADHDSDGWSININGVGIFGNRTTDEGVQYDYYVDNIPDLVEKLNETVKFFSPSYTFYSSVQQDESKVVEVDMDSTESKMSVISVVFNELYLGSFTIDTTDIRTEYINLDGDVENKGMRYFVTCQPNWIPGDDDPQKVIDLNDSAYSGFNSPNYYATNVYNSAVDLKVRIRRFNHDAVISKTLNDSDKAILTKNSASPYVVLTNVLDTITKKGTQEPSESALFRDFYEIAIFDPSINGEVAFFNVGNIIGRGDMEVSEVNGYLKMIEVILPDNLHDLGINYYGYKEESDLVWRIITTGTPKYYTDLGSTYGGEAELVLELPPLNEVNIGDVFKINIGDEEEISYEFYKCTDSDKEYNNVTEMINAIKTEHLSSGTIAKIPNNIDDNTYYTLEEYGTNQSFADLTINTDNSHILDVSDSDLKKALDLIALDEVYTTEGLCDLGNTELSFQNYMANMAVNDNYFYPVSTVNSTNYMTIANNASKISNDSYKLYMLAPWDIDTGNLGWKYYASPSVLYWESVARNRRNNNEFASLFGQSCGVITMQRPVTEFNKKTRQLLLSKRVNTVMWNVATQAWNINDSYTKQNENNIMSEDGNSRLMIRISKAMPTLLRQFIGRKITEKLCSDVEDVIDYFFKTVILPMNYTVDAYTISCVYDEALARQNKIKVVVNVRYSRSLKFIEVYNNAFDVGMDISTTIE